IGSALDDAALDALAAAASAACNPIDDKRGTIEFRTEVAGVLAKRAAKIAYARAKGEDS
ncbi:MAG: xanthine dehydrogenase family protein subunit M, partial [Tateyamaria sp.]